MESLECKSCKHKFDLKDHLPKILPCFHTICLQCCTANFDPLDHQVKCTYDDEVHNISLNELHTNLILQEILTN